MKQTINRFLQTEDIALSDAGQETLIINIASAIVNKLAPEDIARMLAFDELHKYVRAVTSQVFRGLCNVPIPLESNHQIEFLESDRVDLDVNFNTNPTRFDQIKTFGTASKLRRAPASIRTRTHYKQRELDEKNKLKAEQDVKNEE